MAEESKRLFNDDDKKKRAQTSTELSILELEGGNISDFSDKNDDDFDIDPYLKICARNRGTESIIRNSVQSQENQMQLQRKVSKRIKDELDSYMDYCDSVDWIELIKKYKSDYHESLDTVNWKRISGYGDPLYAASLFDMFEWWRDYGKERFPMVGTVALIIFGKPYHNGFQERVFSKGSATDSQLRRKLKEKTFEMSVIEGLNCDIIERYHDWLVEYQELEISKIEDKKKLYAGNYYKHMTTQLDLNYGSDEENDVIVVREDFCDSETDDTSEDEDYFDGIDNDDNNENNLKKAASTNFLAEV
jgi:hypothetical protein